jgi:RHS repeat-associated protein
MKTLRFLVLGLLAMTAVCGAQITNSGSYRVQISGSSPQPCPESITNAESNGASPSGQPAAPVAEAITPEIQALADGLQDDPERIYDYVHDHIAFVLYFGSKKGANLTLLERSGNDFDQCALLVALLRAAGYSNVQYQFGWEEIPYIDTYYPSEDPAPYDLQHWWRMTLSTTNVYVTITNLLDFAQARGYPLKYYAIDSYGTPYLDIQRVWVQLTIGATTYQLDPAFKISEPVSIPTGLSLTNAMGGSGTTISNALLSAAGGTDAGNYTQNLNEPAVRGQLTAYTTNTLNYIQSNCPNATVQDLLGGWQITPADNSYEYSPLTLFATVNPGGNMPIVGWTYEPTNIMSTLAITFAGTSYHWFMPQLQGQRLSLIYSNNGVAQLLQDDTPLAQGQASVAAGTDSVLLTITHPVGTWDTNNNVFDYNPTNLYNATVSATYQSTNATYAIMYAFEPDWGWLQQRENRLDTYLQRGLPANSPQVTSESLNVMGLNWLIQTAKTEQTLGTELGMLPMYYHRFGRMAQETGHGYYVDAYIQLNGLFPAGGSDPFHTQLSNVQFDMVSFFGSALEHGIIEQLQNTNLVGASTVKMLEIANTNDQPVYLASMTNWTTGFNVESHLTPGTYDSGTLATIGNYISSNYYVLLPQNGHNPVSSASGSWAGYGFEARQEINGTATVSAMIIGGGYNGGYSSEDDFVDPDYVDYAGDSQPQYVNNTPIDTPALTGSDPVDVANGTFQVENTDLSLGQAEPRGINLSRYYNGARRFLNPAGMAGGWIHNYSITANNIAAPQACLGDTTPAQAAPMLVATTAAISLYNGGYPDPENWLTTALIAKWGVDQMTKSGVSIVLGKDTVQFIQQPNGAFTPPGNCTATLAQNGSGYSMLQRHGNRFNFGSLGLLTNIVDQYGNALNLTYNSSNWVYTVTDWTNRTLTFGYTGTPSRLTSVSDGTRTVDYGYSTAYNSQGDLTSFTDAEGKTSTYVYDTNHQITATVDANSKLVVTNIYDSQGHITTQYTQGDTNKTWRVYWSGWQTTLIDPAEGELDYYYDDQGRLIGMQNQLGYLAQTSYDGQNHITATVSRLNETDQFVYDANNDLIEHIDPLGYSNVFVYDQNYNLTRQTDARGNPSTFGYNAQFSLTGQTNGAGDWTNYSYYLNGTLHTQTDSGGTTTYGYDNYGQLSSITYPGTLGTNLFMNNAVGDVRTNTNPRGFVTVFQYNNRRQLTSTTAPTNVVSTIVYDAVGNTVSNVDARNFTTTEFWSPTRHLTGTALPSVPEGVPTLTNFYDTRDWLVRSLDPLQHATTNGYDPAQHVISTIDPLLRTTTFGYDADGHQVALTNASMETNGQTWDARGSLIRLTDGAGHYSMRGYDPAGNQTVLTNRNGKIWNFSFDAANQPTSTLTPLVRSNLAIRDNRGLVRTNIDFKNQTATFGYDALGRLTSRTDLVATTTFVYDYNGNLATNSESGQPLIRHFDAYDRVISYQDAAGDLIQYGYDNNGNLTSLVYPGGRTVNYTYDGLNHLRTVTDWANHQTTFGYDLAGHLTSIARPNGTYRTINYDAAGEATNILEQMSNTLPIALFGLNWNSNSTAQWEFAAPLPHSNSLPTRIMTYNDDNSLKTVNSQNVTNDLNGNMTYGPLTTNGVFTTCTYDARNRLTSAGGLGYGYDPAGSRVSVTNGSAVTQYVINPNTKLPQVLMRIRPGVTNYYVYGAGLLYEVDETATETNTLTYHYDYRGSTIALTDPNGNVTDRVEYSAYGLTTYRAGTNDTPFLFNGRYGVQTDANGLLYMLTRYYNPYICRFLNPDPSGFAGGLNWYAYANGNPVSYLDPFGLGAALPTEPAAPPGPGNPLPDVHLFFYPNVFPPDQAIQSPDSTPFVPEAPYFDPSQPTVIAVQFGPSPGPLPNDPALTEAFQGIEGIGIITTAILTPELDLIPEGPATTTQFLSTESGIVDIESTLNRIDSGGSFPHPNDGSVFQNREGLLPTQPYGYYNEYVVPTPGVNGPGPMRIITGQNGDLYFTPNHYQTFVPLNH